MKRHLITTIAALCLLGGSDAVAQNNRFHGMFGKSDIALTVGYLHSGYRNREFVSGDVLKDKGLNGLYLELAKDIPLVGDNLYLQPGLSYAYQGASARFTEGGIAIMNNRNEHYLDIPVRIKYSMNLGPDLKAFVYAGPTFDFGLSATMKYRAKVSDQMGKFIYNYYNGEIRSDNFGTIKPEVPAGAYRRFDLLLGTAIGIEFFDMGELKLGFDWGLLNKNKNENVSDYMTTHRNLFHLGVGVRF